MPTEVSSNAEWLRSIAEVERSNADRSEQQCRPK